jgi:hypothetical protein
MQPHFLTRLPPAVARRAAAQFVQEQVSGSLTKNADPALLDIRSLDDGERSLEALVRAISPDEPGRSSPTPWFQRSGFDDLLNPAIRVITRETPRPDHRAFTRLIPALDYREHTFLAGIGGMDVELVHDGGELTDADLSGLGFDTGVGHVKRYGRIATLRVEQVANDDSGAFGRLAQEMTLAAFRREAALTYSVLTSNPTLSDGDTLFIAGNSASGATVAAALEAGLEKFAGQAFASGAYAGLQPATLIVPPSWSTLGLEITNLASRGVRVITSPYVSDAYLMADPNQAPVIGLFAFGEGVPDVQLNPKRSSRFGIQLSVVHSFGVTALSRIGVVKMSITS